jgi:hypothetical protein
MQQDQSFLFLGVEDESAHLYLGNMQTFQKIDSVYFVGNPYKSNELSQWLKDWLYALSEKSTPKLYLAGERIDCERVLKKTGYPKNSYSIVKDAYSDQQAKEICSELRVLVRRETQKSLQKVLLEFKSAEHIQLTQKDIHEIASAAVQGRVEKLVVVDGVQIFGKIDRKTGSLKVHPFDLDHEDDDVLDDLAQIVLAHGGEVLVVASEDLPKGRPAIAILRAMDSEKAQFVGALPSLTPAPIRMRSV